MTTPKGDASTRDTLITFRKHLLWALVFGVPLALSFTLGHDHVSMRAWSFASLIVCLLPVAIWRVELSRERRAKRTPVQAPAPVAHLRPVPDLPPEPLPAPVSGARAGAAARARGRRGGAEAAPRRALRPAARAATGRATRAGAPAGGRAAQEPRGRPL